MLKINEEEAKVVRKVYELNSRGYNNEEIATILDKEDVISGIVARIDSVEDKLIGLDIEIKNDLDYQKVLESREQEAIEKIIVKRLEQYKDCLKQEQEDITKDIDFIINESRKIYINKPEKISNTKIKKKNTEIPYGYEEM